jgi:RNA polymerase sigma-70 factor (ECF subfamily)
VTGGDTDGGRDEQAGIVNLPASEATAEQRLAELHTRYGPQVLNYLVKLTLGDHRLAEDILQETFLRAWRHLERNDDVDLDTFRPWLFAVARRLMIDVLRARRARPTEVMYEDFAQVSLVDDTIGDALAAGTVRDALAQLRPDQRSLLLDLYYYGRSPAEVAAKLDIPVGTVKSRSHLAKKSLRALLEAAGDTA